MSRLFKNIASFIFITFSFLFSVSAPPFPFEVQQPDGSKITVLMFGDEYYNWMETEDGYVIDLVEDESRHGWYYRDLDSDGRFYPTNILVKYPAPDYLDIPKQLREMSPKIRAIKHHNLHSSINHSTYLDRSASSSLIKPLVFLVDFNRLPADMPDREYSKDQFQHLLFDTNLNSNNANLPSDYDMSVRDYYDEISNEALEISGDDESIAEWTPVDYDYSYYVDEEQGSGQGPNGITHSAAALVVEIAMDKDSEINFADFDGDSDGVVDFVLLIVEGWGNGDNDQFWPHMSQIQSGNNGIGAFDVPANNIDLDGYFSLDGVAIKKYIVIPEQFHMNYYGISKNDIHPIGTICHEMGHVLGLPDLYDTSENSAAGIGEWGLMGSGNWQRPTSPAYMSAWSRYRLGFIEPVILENIMDYALTIQPAEQNVNSAAFILPMASNLPQEYLLIENRQRIGSDQHLDATGMLVWHIDETITDMYPAINSVNVNQDFYGVNLLQADGLGELYTDCNTCADSGDPYPYGTTNVLSANTNPNTDTYDYDRDADGDIDMGTDSGIELVNIEESNGEITLMVTNPNMQGEIIGYDEGSFTGRGINDTYSFLQWAGIRVVANETALLAGVNTVFPPSFWSPWDVIDYTIQIWEGWVDDKDLNVRVGVHLGDTIFEKGDIRGDGVNIASRLESMAVEGGVFVSKEVHDQLANQKEFDGVSLGLQSMKGVGRVIEVFGLKGDMLNEPNPSEYEEDKIDKHSDNEVPSIAIIPFRNKGKEEDSFYAFSISADLISDCSGAGLIRVASLADIEKVENWDKLKADELSSTLFVRYIAQGTLWKMDDMFQLSVELYDTKDKKVVWLDRWQEGWDNLTAIKENLSDGLLKALDTSSNIEKRVDNTNTEAYEYYLKGKYKYEKRENKEDREIAQGLLQKALELDMNLLDARGMLGWTYMSSDEYDKSMKCFTETLKRANKLGDKLRIAHTYASISSCFTNRGNKEYDDESLKMAFKAVEIYEEIGNKWGIARTLRTIGIIYGNQHLHDKALEYSFRSLEISKEIGDEKNAALGHVGHIYNRIGDYDRALECQQKVLIKQEETDFKPGVSNTLQKISVNYEDMGEYDKALDYANRAFKIAEKLGDNSKIILCLDSIGIIYYKMGNYKKTVEYLEKSLSIYDKTKEGINLLLLNITYLYLAYKKLGKAYDKKKLQVLIKEEREIAFELNFGNFQLLEETSYLETAYNQVQEKADNLEPDVAAKFLSYPIPKAIVEEWEKVK